MEKLEWNAPYLDHKNWILSHLDILHVDAKEALVLLLIDYLNSNHIPVVHSLIGEKLKMNEEEVETIFESLSDKGYLTIDFQDGDLVFSIEGVFNQENVDEVPLEKSLLQEFSDEFGRPLNPNEMDRILNLASIYDERMVLVALNEAACYDKHDINYIERILISWKNKGLSIEDVENGKR